MGHYAKVTNGKVVKVIVAEASFFNNFVDDSPGKWIQTSYNTRGGVHYKPNTNEPSPTLVTMIINDGTSSFTDENAMHSYTASLLQSFTTSSEEFSASLLDPETSGTIEAPTEPTFGEIGSNDQSQTLALRGNYAGVGHIYDSTHDAFYAPQPYNSWELDTGSFLWESPVPYPTGDATGSYTGSYQWDESSTNWITSSI